MYLQLLHEAVAEAAAHVGWLADCLQDWQRPQLSSRIMDVHPAQHDGTVTVRQHCASPYFMLLPHSPALILATVIEFAGWFWQALAGPRGGMGLGLGDAGLTLGEGGGDGLGEGDGLGLMAGGAGGTGLKLQQAVLMPFRAVSSPAPHWASIRTCESAGKQSSILHL